MGCRVHNALTRGLNSDLLICSEGLIFNLLRGLNRDLLKYHGIIVSKVLSHIY